MNMQTVLERQNLYESSARTYPRRLPLVLKRGKGVWVTDVEGKNYIDCLSGAGALPLGHNHPQLISAIQGLLQEEIPLMTLDLMTPIKDQFLQELLQTLPLEWREKVRVQFCGPTGADAVEAALKLAKWATGRRSVIAFQGAYHGMTHGTLGLTGNLAAKSQIANLMGEVHFFPYPYSYRCPFGLGGEMGAKVAANYFERVLKDDESGIPRPAAVILEVIQGEGGVIPAPISWLKEVRRVTRELGIPLIIDEVQTGIGRTGSLFAFEKAGILPDMLVLSKALGGGLPLSVMIYNREWDAWPAGAHAGTFRGNQLAFAQGIETMNIVRQETFLLDVREKGEYFVRGLQAIQGSCPCLGEVRAEGLMVGVEIVNPAAEKDLLGSLPPDGQLAREIQAECLKRGLIVELGGRQGCVARFLPPLIITREELGQVLNIFHESIQVGLSRRESQRGATSELPREGFHS